MPIVRRTIAALLLLAWSHAAAAQPSSDMPKAQGLDADIEALAAWIVQSSGMTGVPPRPDGPGLVRVRHRVQVRRSSDAEADRLLQACHLAAAREMARDAKAFLFELAVEDIELRPFSIFRVPPPYPDVTLAVAPMDRSMHAAPARGDSDPPQFLWTGGSVPARPASRYLTFFQAMLRDGHRRPADCPAA